MAESKSVEAAMQAAVDRSGSVNLLVNNAGIIRDYLLCKLEEDELNDVIDVHMKGRIYACGRLESRR